MKINFNYEELSKENVLTCFLIYYYKKDVKSLIISDKYKAVKSGMLKPYQEAYDKIILVCEEENLIKSIINNVNTLLSNNNYFDIIEERYIKKYRQSSSASMTEYRKFLRRSEAIMKRLGSYLSKRGYNNDLLFKQTDRVIPIYRKLAKTLLKCKINQYGREIK